MSVWYPAGSPAQMAGIQLPIHALGTPSASAPTPRRRGSNFKNRIKPFNQGTTSGVASNAGTRGETSNLSWNVPKNQLYTDPSTPTNAVDAQAQRDAEIERQRQLSIRGAYAPSTVGSPVWYPGVN